MMKERSNVLRAHIFVIIAVSSLILYLAVGGLNFLPSRVRSNTKLDEENQLFVDEGKQAAPGPFFGPILSLRGAKAPSPITPVVHDDVKQLRRRNPISSIDAVTPDSNPNSPSASPDFSSLYPESEISSTPEATESTIDGGGDASAPDLNPNSPSSSSSPDSFSLFPVSHISSIPAMAPGTDGGGDVESPVSNPNLPSFSPGPSEFFDPDIALALEARIKQSQADSQAAMDEAKRLLEDPEIANSETGKCLGKCVDKYAASLDDLNRAVADLGVRDVTLLAGDFEAVETAIYICQACFTHKIGEDSPLKTLEEATTKAARECLTVMDYAV